MAGTEITVGRWKVKRVDSMNWQVFERREVKANHATDRSGEIDWMACPAFFSELPYALEWCYGRETADMGVRKDLKDAISQMRAIKTQFVNAVEDAVAAERVKGGA